MAETLGRILVIDDASLVRRYYRAALEPAGFAVSEALNGVEALEKLLTESVDMLIVDVNMPQMDGLTFLATLRRRQGLTAALPALVISTESAVCDRAQAQAAGANFYLVKPVPPAVLVEHAMLMCGIAP